MTLLNHAIVNAIEAPVDILLNSEEEILEKQDLPGAYRAYSYERRGYTVMLALLFL